MGTPLLNKRIAILAADGFEQSELEEPMHALEEAGAQISIVSPQADCIQGMRHADKGDKFDVDIPLENAREEDFDALLLPGGLMNPDTLRSTPAAVNFVRAFAASGKPIGAICHAPWILIEAGLVQGRRLTSWPAIQSDVKNAGGNWLDEEVIVDNGIVTSRMPDDIPAFTAKLIEEIAEGRHAGLAGAQKRRGKAGQSSPPKAIICRYSVRIARRAREKARRWSAIGVSAGVSRMISNGCGFCHGGALRIPSKASWIIPFTARNPSMIPRASRRCAWSAATNAGASRCSARTEPRA